MYKSLLMHKTECKEKLVSDACHLSLIESALTVLDQFMQVSALKKLHYYKVVVFIFQHVVRSYNVRVLSVAQNFHLSSYLVLPLMTLMRPLLVQEFNGTGHPRLFVKASVD